MSRTADILCKLPSYLLHPFWMPTYAISILLLCCFSGLPSLYVTWAIVGTFIFTALIPLLISILYMRNTVQGLEMTDRHSRIAPYIYTVCCYTFWCYFLGNALQMPSYIFGTAIGATIALTILLLLTLKWKISAHMLCFGGIIGSTLAVCYSINIMPTMFITTLFALAMILAWSRTYMQAHTPEELGIGFLIGILCTYVPCLII